MFGTSGIRGPFGETMTADLALSVGRALAMDGAESIVVGRDPRVTGALLVDALTAGGRECGADVIDLGLVATPTVARSVDWKSADAGVVITASHNPPSDNGIKLFSPSGMAFDQDRRDRISALVSEEQYRPAKWDAVGHRQRWDNATEQHQQAIVNAIGAVESLSVIVDVGNGAAGVTAGALRELGCSVRTINGHPDGRFPAREIEPTAEACKDLSSLVQSTDADLGIAHDGDGDRMMAVDEQGRYLEGDVLLALFSRVATTEGESVAAPLNTSLAVDDALTDIGASVTRTKVGDVYVAERISTGDGVVFGGEPSGAWIWPEETLCPDGPLAAAKLVELVSRSEGLASLVDTIEQYPLFRDSIEVEDKLTVVEQVATTLQSEYTTVETTDGCRVETDEGWFLIRASGTQPLVRITAEARAETAARDLFETAREYVREAQTTV